MDFILTQPTCFELLFCITTYFGISQMQLLSPTLPLAIKRPLSITRPPHSTKFEVTTRMQVRLGLDCLVAWGLNVDFILTQPSFIDLFISITTYLGILQMQLLSSRLPLAIKRPLSITRPPHSTNIKAITFDFSIDFRKKPSKCLI